MNNMNTFLNKEVRSLTRSVTEVELFEENKRGLRCHIKVTLCYRYVTFMNQ